MTQRNDQIFQLSLTEIAFTISFLLLLLLGYLVVNEQAARKAAEEALAKTQGMERSTQAFGKAKAELGKAMRDSGVTNPDEAITRLIAADETRAERDRLKQRVEDLDAQVRAMSELQTMLDKTPDTATKKKLATDEVWTALAIQNEVRKALEGEAPRDPEDVPHPDDAGKGTAASAPKPAEPASASASAAAPASTPQSPAPPPPTAGAFAAKPAEQQTPAERHRQAVDFVKDAIATSGAFKREVKDKLNRNMQPGEGPKAAQDVVDAAASYGRFAKTGLNPEQARKENAGLRGQVAFLRNRLDARGGRDYPPCWADEAGKVEFLFAIELRPDAVVIAKAWPSTREADAMALPGVAEALAQSHAFNAFRAAVQPVFSWSKKQDPECRHYVQLRSTISDAVQSDRARLMVENYFYKVELRR